MLENRLLILLLSFGSALLPLNGAFANQEVIVFEENFEPPGDGQPKDTEVGGSRDDLSCAPDEPAIRALMPQRNYALSLATHPAIFLDLPQTSAQQVVLSFRDETGEYYERVFLPIERDGIVSFSFPNDKPPLVVGKNYQWTIGIVCQEYLKPGDPALSGWVQRVERTASIEAQLGGMTAQEQAQWYGERGYWYDMLSVLFQNEQLGAEWANIMDYVSRSELH
ncbi:MAG: DUF928 domain-containing protein [Cyanophyceae cyanobacterium]